MLALQRIVAARGLARPYWERSRREHDPRRPPLPGLPEHLRRPRQHRRARAAGGVARARARRDARSGWATRRPRRARPLLRRRRPGPRAGARRREPRGEGRARCARRSPAAPRRLPSAAATSCSAAATAAGTARSMPGVGSAAARDGGRRAADDRRRARSSASSSRAWRRTLAGFENHAGRTRLDPGAEPLGRVVAGFGNDGESGFEGCRAGRVIGTYLHGPLLPRNPWLADWLLAQALAHRSGGEARRWTPLPDELERAGACGLRRARPQPRRAVTRAPRAAPRYTAGSPGSQRRRKRWIGGWRTMSSSSLGVEQPVAADGGVL